MYDRLIRAGLWSSNRVVDLHDDSHRLLYVFLVMRADDFGNQEGDLRALLREVCQCTQIHTIDALGAALDAMMRETVDLVRAYQVDGATFLHLPRFQSTRTYTSRKVPASPWCDPAAPTGAIRGGVRGPSWRGTTKRGRKHQVATAPQHNGLDDVDKPSTNDQHAPDMRQVSDSPAPDMRQTDECATIRDGSEAQALEDAAKEANSAPDLSQVSDSPASDLSPGVGVKDLKPKDKSAFDDHLPRATRLPPGWTIPDDLVAWSLADAAARGFTRLPRTTVERVAASFADYWHAKAGSQSRKVDWPATWRIWWRNTDLAKFAPGAADQTADVLRRAL
jgi:hypothetical protein